MGIGYVLGCLLSILFKKIDKYKILEKVYHKSKKIIKADILFIVILAVFFIALKYAFMIISDEEIKNFVTFIICIDISNTEFVNLKNKGNKNFYNSISTITKALVGGFIGPVLYAALFGNLFAVFYYILFLTNDILDKKLTNILIRILNIIPAFLAGLLFYLIYIIRYKTFKIDFKGDFFINSILNPLLNLNIIAANLESINFYYFKSDYDIKNYGSGKCSIDSICIKEFLNHTYFVCLISFIIFIVIEIFAVI
ncbi:MAG: hypothetical protein WCQ54_00175 [Clostridiaceae bacterium]